MAVFIESLPACCSTQAMARTHRSEWWRSAHVNFYKYFFIFAVILCSSGSTVSLAENLPSSAMEYQIKAAFLYKFCLYIDWPPTAFANANSPFVFGIAAPDSFISELNTVVKDHTINNRPVQVRRIDDGDLTDVNVLFVARPNQTLLPQLRVKIQNSPLLIVTESEHGLDDGGTINFSLKNNRVIFEVALDTANQQGLRLSAQLLKVASNVRGESMP